MIENIELRAFVLENLSFARTMVIKNEDLAVLDNALMLKHYNLNSGTDKTKWRYYLNLNGEYHVTDEQMTIKSLDNNENIAFTKAMLNGHPATKRAYRLGGYYFSRLAAKYPHQLELIQGIINPIPQSESIKADNYQILRYTKEYVENNESQLIPELQNHINKLAYQCFNTEYKYTDCLTMPVLIAHAHESIFKFLLQNRFENRATRHAHSFYIWSHLQSRGISPVHKEILNEKQTMWLFRNIDWTLRNLGKEETFKQLIDILLTERKITLSKYDAVYTTEDIKKTLSPNALYYSERLNLIETKGLNPKFEPIKDIMRKEIPESLDNEINYEKFLSSTVYESTYSEQINYPTKILNSELVDTTNRKHETFFHVLNNELIYLAGKNLYNINLDIEDPVTGVYHRLSIKDCIVMWYHLLNCYNGNTLCDKIPSFYYKNAMKVTPPTAKQMSLMGAKPFLNEAWCNDVLKLHVRQIRIVSPSIFYENATEIFHAKWKHKKMYSQWLSVGYYSRRKNAVLSMYETGFMKLTTKKTYKEFLSQFEFDFSDYQKEDYLGLMWNIWKKMTGWDQFSHITIAQIQESMMALMRELSSYSVQYIYQTQLQDGWYEGGLDLFTENPMLLSSKGDGQLELENGVDADRIEIPHRVVMIKNEEEETLYLDNRIDKGDSIIIPEMSTNVFETPKLYPVEYDDKDSGLQATQLIMSDYKLRNFTGKLPYELEDLIPKGGLNYDKHTLKEMIVERFDGPVNAGPWEAVRIELVKNNLDNSVVADKVDDFNYTKYNKTTRSTVNNVSTNTYFIGFVPDKTGSHTVKLDIVAKHKETSELVYLRFDYRINVKTNPWVTTLSIPAAVKINVPFTVEPKITNLSLGTVNSIKESLTPHPTVTTWLKTTVDNNVPKGEFIKINPPDTLPVLYTIETKNSNKDDTALHFYYMKSTIPGDRLYDPLTDPEFDPKPFYNEADTTAITVEKFSLTASNKGWTATNIYIKKVDGKVPTDKVKVDYAEFTGFLEPRLSERKFTDATVNGKVIRTFEWLFVPAKADVTLDLIVELTNSSGETVERPFTYKPKVVDHKVNYTYDILPYKGFEFGKGHLTETSLVINNFNASTFKINKALTPVAKSGQSKTALIFELSDNNSVVTGNKISGFSVKPAMLIYSTYSWAVQIEGVTKTASGKELTLIPYGKITIDKEQVIDYDKYGTMDIIPWGDDTVYVNIVNPVRVAVEEPINGWEIVSFEKDEKHWDAHWDSRNGVYAYITNIKSGIDKDGNDIVPKGCKHWITFYGAMRSYISSKAAYIYVNIKSKYTGAELSVSRGINLTTSSTAPVIISQTPSTIYAGEETTVKLVWENYPLTNDKNVEVVKEEFSGSEFIVTGGGQTGVAKSNNHEEYTLDIPPSPLTYDRTITWYNLYFKTTFRRKDTKYLGTSLQDMVYLGSIKSFYSQILSYRPITLEDIGFTPLASDFHEGARCSFVYLFDKDKIEKSRRGTIYSIRLKNVTDEPYNLNVYDKRIYSTKSMLKQPGLGFEQQYLSVVPKDTPKGKENLAARSVSFIPVVSGKEVFFIEFTISQGGVKKTYDCEFVLDIKPKITTIDFVRDETRPFFFKGYRTNAEIAIKNLPSDTVSKTFRLFPNESISGTELGSNQDLFENEVISVKNDAKYYNYVYIYCAYDTVVKGYPSDDPRSIRNFIGIVNSGSGVFYDDWDLLPKVWVKERITQKGTFNNYESVYDVHRLYKNVKGWSLDDFYTSTSWYPNHSFSGEGMWIKDEKLGNEKPNPVTSFDGYIAGSNEILYPVFHGGAEQFDSYRYIVLTNKHIEGYTSLKHTDKMSYTLEPSLINLDFKYDYLVGKGFINKLKGGPVGLSSIKVKEGMELTGPVVYVFSRQLEHVSFDANTNTLIYDNNYKLSEQGGVVITYVYHLRNKNGKPSMDDRSYRATQTFPNTDILDFSATMYGDSLYTGLVSTGQIRFGGSVLYPATGWKVVSVDIKGIHDGTYDKTLVRGEDEAFDFDEIYDVTEYSNYWRMRFIPEYYTGEERERTFVFTAGVKKGNDIIYLDFEYTGKVVQVPPLTTTMLLGVRPFGEIKHYYAANCEPYKDIIKIDGYPSYLIDHVGVNVKPYGETKKVMLPYSDGKNSAAYSVGNTPGIKAFIKLEFTGEINSDYTFKVMVTVEKGGNYPIGLIANVKIDRGMVRDFDKIPDSVFTFKPRFNKYMYIGEEYVDTLYGDDEYEGLKLEPGRASVDDSWALSLKNSSGGLVFNNTVNFTTIRNDPKPIGITTSLMADSGTKAIIDLTGTLSVDYTNYKRNFIGKAEIPIKAKRTIPAFVGRRYIPNTLKRVHQINMLGGSNIVNGDTTQSYRLTAITKGVKIENAANHEMIAITASDINVRHEVGASIYYSVPHFKGLYKTVFSRAFINEVHGYEIALTGHDTHDYSKYVYDIDSDKETGVLTLPYQLYFKNEPKEYDLSTLLKKATVYQDGLRTDFAVKGNNIVLDIERNSLIQVYLETKIGNDTVYLCTKTVGTYKKNYSRGYIIISDCFETLNDELYFSIACAKDLANTNYGLNATLALTNNGKTETITGEIRDKATTHFNLVFTKPRKDYQFISGSKIVLTMKHTNPVYPSPIVIKGYLTI